MQTEELRARVLKAAETLFIDRGYAAVTTDGIARACGISKKTLYSLFSSKKGLLEEVVNLNLDQIAGQLAAIRTDDADALDKLMASYALISGCISRLGGLMVKELYRTVPDVWTTVDEFRQNIIFSHFSSLMRQAKQEGVMEANCDENIVTLVIFILMKNLLTPAVLAELPYSIHTVFETCIRMINRGILTDQGRRRFARFFHGKVSHE